MVRNGLKGNGGWILENTAIITRLKMNTGSVTRDGTGDLEDQKDCREGTGGGAPCQEMGTEVK